MSGSTVAYHLRVNKHIDRRLFLEALAMVAQAWPIGEYAYISMGGGYLEDFRVLHQAFGIRAMLSFDYEEWMIDRQCINRPYGFIRCVAASSTDIIDRLEAERAQLVGQDGRLIIWLDYTQPSKRIAQLQDLESLLKKLVEGDVFRITLNASRAAFGAYEQYAVAKKEERTKHATVEDWWHEKLVRQLGSYLPQERNNPEYMGSEEEFAATLAQAIKRAAQRGLQSRPELEIEPLLSVRYADSNHQMLTLTAAVVRKDNRAAFRDRIRWESWPYKPGPSWDACVHLDVPHLSQRERQLIHEMMYFNGWTNAGARLPFRLDRREARHSRMVDQYPEHYRRYPTFAPVDLF
jgi:hypothetical protein